MSKSVEPSLHIKCCSKIISKHDNKYNCVVPCLLHFLYHLDDNCPRAAYPCTARQILKRKRE